MGDIPPLAVAALLALACYLLVVGSILIHRRVTSPIAHRGHPRLDARRRAESLLRDILSPDEYERLKVEGCLAVPSRGHPGRVYEIPRYGGVVAVREGGKVIGGLCLRPVEPLPAADAVAMHKLMLEGAEEEFLRWANPMEPRLFVQCCLGTLFEP